MVNNYDRICQERIYSSIYENNIGGINTLDGNGGLGNTYLFIATYRDAIWLESNAIGTRGWRSYGAIWYSDGAGGLSSLVANHWPDYTDSDLATTS